MFQQGINIKTSSIINDEHENRTPEKFRDDCNKILFCKIPSAPESISVKTASRWMKSLGFISKQQTNPELVNDDSRVVLITHDESTSYCCEGKPMLWMENGRNKLLPKTKGLQ